MLSSCSHIPAENKKAAITVDIAFGESYVEDILEVLKEENVPATFFLVGMLKDKKDVSMIAESGFPLAIHSYKHKSYLTMSEEEIISDINKTEIAIKELGGSISKYVRPPYFLANERAEKCINSLGYKLILGLDSLDWKQQGARKTLENVLSKIKSGDAVIFQSNVFETPYAIKLTITELKKRGYKIVALEELEENKNE